MSGFQPQFTITKRMAQAITRIEWTREVTPLSSNTFSLLRVQKRGVQG
jgi:hypothetical protein